MPQDAFHVKRLASELNALLVGGKINRISQVSKDELTFIIYTGKSTVKLILSTNATSARVCLSETEKEPLAVAPNFCMLLRKHLQNAEIIKIEQYAFERIIQITLHCTSDFSECDRVLYCELMGKYSNLILTEKGVILGALKTTSLTDDMHRILLSGAKYEYPVPQDKISPLDRAGMRSLFENAGILQDETDGYGAIKKDVESETLARFIFENIAGLALPTAREIVKRVQARGHNAPAPVWDFIANFCENEPCNAHIKKENLNPSEYFAFPVDGGEKVQSLCKAEDIYYSHRENKKSFDDKRRKLESAIVGYKKKASKRLQSVLERLLDADKADENRIKGELLTANLYRIEKGARFIELENWYDEQGGTVKITLDSTLSPVQNAQRYFKSYNKQKRAKEVLTPMREKEESEIEYADGVLATLKFAETETDLQEIETELIELGVLRAPAKRVGGKKKETEIPFREYEHGGMKILVGRNNLQNDRLLKLASADDIWLHTQKYHSAHAIIITNGKQLLTETLIFTAEICAYYSDGKGADKIPVDYCKRKFVKKPPKSKAGFVVYTDYKTVLVAPNAHN